MKLITDSIRFILKKIGMIIFVAFVCIILLSIFQTVKTEFENELKRRTSIDIIEMEVSLIDLRIGRLESKFGEQRAKVLSMEDDAPSMYLHPFKYGIYQAQLQLERQLSMRYRSRLIALRRQKQSMLASIGRYEI